MNFTLGPVSISEFPSFVFKNVHDEETFSAAMENVALVGKH